MSEQVRDFGEVRLNVSEEGTGSTIVLLHGWSYDLHLWDHLSAELVAHGWRVVRVDLRGHGRSPVAGPYPFARLDRDLELVLAELAPDLPVLVGLSLGGFLAMRHAIAHPSSVRGVVLADTWTTPIASDAQMAATLPTAADGPCALAQWWEDRHGGPKAMADDPQRIAARNRFAGLAADGLRHAIAACAERSAVSTEQLAQIEAPTLVIAGEHDRMFSPQMHASIAAAIPNARVHIIPGAGHISVADAPEEFTREVLAFLARLPEPDPKGACR